jgi:hypothetical protein
MFKAASRIFAKSLPLVLARTVSFCTLTPRGASRGCAIICIGRDDSWPVPPPDLTDRRMRGIPYFPEFIQRLLGRRDRGRRIDGAFGRFHRLCGRAERVSESIEEVYQKTQVQAVHCVLLRASLGYVSWKQRRALAADLRAISAPIRIPPFQRQLHIRQFLHRRPGLRHPTGHPQLATLQRLSLRRTGHQYQTLRPRVRPGYLLRRRHRGLSPLPRAIQNSSLRPGPLYLCLSCIEIQPSRVRANSAVSVSFAGPITRRIANTSLE